ncbi:MarR family transcriptional regulator [Tunturiibacter empetritectus]|uniref:DNA-binding MarR family transcriptional regulator n=1 Tax=Tunturiibacter lichenicola TaxID=2051959 RepID=A0A852VFY8_9BACT|nr:MarR family transcriptional regulator [Edaphobacter lichenicola]NYF89155.1 DNA-binding MarR family transcriptional regulator [Edaphobacter lichenicola]
MVSLNSNGVKRQAERRRAAQMMKRILIHFRSQMDEALRPQGVTTAQLHILKTLREEPGVSGAQLARLCYVTPQSAQSLLTGLARDGWIVRNKGRGNDRILAARLTAEGEELLQEAEKMVKVIEGKLWRGVAESSIEALNGVLEQCLANLGPEPDGR